MSDKLPESIDPLLLAERRAILSGTLKLAAFERLSDLVVNRDGDVLIDLVFDKQGKRAVINGTVKTMLALQCQSCLQELAWPVDISLKLGVVSSLQDVDRLEIDCEPLLLNDEKVSLVELIEDEVLLVLPDYPRHAYDCIQHCCSQDDNYDEHGPSKAHNPFSVLAKLKKTGE